MMKIFYNTVAAVFFSLYLSSAQAQLPLISGLPIPGLERLPGLDSLPALPIFKGGDPLALFALFPQIVDQNQLPGTEIIPKFNADSVDSLIVIVQDASASLGSALPQSAPLGDIGAQLLDVVDVLLYADPIRIQNELLDVGGVLLTGFELNIVN